MNRTVSVAKYCLFTAAAGACALAIVLGAPGEPSSPAPPPRTTYLDCARVLAEQVDPDLVALCSMLA